ncbi:MAG TPA: MarR family transcriptional regulator [Spirochaetota bacterium]|nr:MarR family transcriptional regulator [Spirochaetota bacterium]
MQDLCHVKEVMKEIYSFEKELREQSSLTINEALVLCSLLNSDSSAGHLASEIGLSPARMSKVLSSLEKRELVVRSLGVRDKRIMEFKISNEGKKLITTLKEKKVKVPDFSVI